MAPFVGRRDHGSKREGMERQALVDGVTNILEEIQSNLFARALAFREENTVTIDSKEELCIFTPQNKSKPEMHGGFALVHWDRDPQWEERLKNDLKVTVRCIRKIRVSLAPVSFQVMKVQVVSY